MLSKMASSTHDYRAVRVRITAITPIYGYSTLRDQSVVSFKRIFNLFVSITLVALNIMWPIDFIRHQPDTGEKIALKHFCQALFDFKRLHYSFYHIPRSVEVLWKPSKNHFQDNRVAKIIPKNLDNLTIYQLNIFETDFRLGKATLFAYLYNMFATVKDATQPCNRLHSRIALYGTKVVPLLIVWRNFEVLLYIYFFATFVCTNTLNKVSMMEFKLNVSFWCIFLLWWWIDVWRTPLFGGRSQVTIIITLWFGLSS
jgi:hypothetical protein